LELFERVRKEHPKTDWSGEALTGIAQVYQAQKDYLRARKTFQQVIAEMPGGFLAAEAQASIGSCLEAEEKVKEAVNAYQVVLDKYPSAVWDQAKARIEVLKKQLEDKKRAKKSKPS
jgi:TolA-binding protein